ncbi:hypothetical protein [Microlunatus sp. Gsoil 973]|uniref:hypothetical protein n=1 Tax=Microlunatus sp. Gsoil 973 TaxID=2672569 RepID=UPI0012B466FB|nr:hypothetical protein [Microlunatus sp. Gsoil 973]QGN34085.1 hypothetical protein GJV80_16080 [Microlunatus sp. Gsoil 973]
MPEVHGRNTAAEKELRALCSALHLDAPVVRRFIGDYLRLLQFRLDRIDRDLSNGDVPAAAVGLLSLATSSSMLGATDVAEAADQLRRQAAAGDLAAVAEGLSALVQRAHAAELRLVRMESVETWGARPGHTAPGCTA